MNPEEIQAAIEEAVDVTPPLVLAAKAHLVTHAIGRTNEAIEAFAAHMGASIVQPVVIHHSIDPAGIIRDVARWLSCQRAAREAVWALIGAGALVPLSDRMEGPELGIGWTTVMPGSGGSSSGWRFGRAIPVPAEVSLPSSGATYLTDGDLFLGGLDLPDLDAKIAESLREGVVCFRHDLYTPAQVMLGRAAEGAWTLLGDALVNAAPGEAAAASVGRDLARGIHFKNLPERVATLYTATAYAPIVTASGVSHADLRSIVIWTAPVREARNAVHHTIDAPVPATWETTAALYMGAVPALRRLWAMTSTARAAR